MAIIELRGVSYNYSSKFQRVDALKHVTCSFEEGKVYAIVGKSGSGKSTLLSLLAGLDLPSAGEVLYEGKPTSTMDLAKYRRECAAMIYQNFRLFPLLTVSENITFPMELRGFAGEKARQRARELVERVALPESVLDRFPGMLSGGEQQRVGIARAIVTDPTLLLCDEPTGDLDRKAGDEILDLLQGLNREHGKTIIMVTHDPHASARASRTVHLDKGRICDQPVT